MAPGRRNVVGTTLGGRLRRAREEAGLRQEDVARATGVSPRNVIRYEQDELVPSADYVRLLADRTGRDAAWIVMGTDSPAHARLDAIAKALHASPEMVRAILDCEPGPRPSPEDLPSVDTLRRSGRLPEDRRRKKGDGSG